MKIFKKKQKRTFIYEPYGDNGDAVLLYFHKKPTSQGNFDDTWDMTGVDVPTKECPEWSFWRNIQNETDGNDNEEGKVIAKIDLANGTVEYLDEDARTDEDAQVVINEFLENGYVLTE